ncbi:hypothetical protein NHG32_06325 [Aerococcaceae bacterium NML191219]|nr:hypothetical protein [Aerococcaceae bacterium NML191219]
MDAKEILNRVKEIRKEIRLKQNLVQTYRTIAEGLQSPRYSDIPKNPNRKLQPMADALNTALAFEDEIRVLEEEIIRVQTCIFQVIQSIDNKEHQLILLERYVNEKSWKEISHAMGYANSRIFDKHNHALMDFSIAYEKFGVNRSSSE